MVSDWDEVEAPAAQAGRIVAGLVRLASDDEACRLLGVDATLEDELDLMFVNDPVSWIANEIASGIRLADAEDDGVALSGVVALLRLCRVLRGGTLDEAELREAVVELLEEDEEEDD